MLLFSVFFAWKWSVCCSPVSVWLWGQPGSPSHSWGAADQPQLLRSLAPKNAGAGRSPAGEWCVCVALKGALCCARAGAESPLGSWRLCVLLHTADIGLDLGASDPRAALSMAGRG